MNRQLPSVLHWGHDMAAFYAFANPSANGLRGRASTSAVPLWVSAERMPMRGHARTSLVNSYHFQIQKEGKKNHSGTPQSLDKNKKKMKNLRNSYGQVKKHRAVGRIITAPAFFHFMPIRRHASQCICWSRAENLGDATAITCPQEGMSGSSIVLLFVPHMPGVREW